MAIAARRPYVVRVNSGGNFCGHDPAAPKLGLPAPTTSRQRPKILGELQRRIEAYYSRPQALPALNSANGSTRQQRSERREACLQMLAVIIEYLDLVTLRVGTPSKKGFQPLTLQQLVSRTHLGLRRAERALADLSKAGLIMAKQPREQHEDGSWSGLAAIRAVNAALFAVFGLGKNLARERARAAERLRERIPQAVGSMAGWTRAKLSSRKGERTRPRRATVDSFTYEHRRVEILLAIRAAHPGWSADQVNAESHRLLKGL